jgi:hypothetical protein
VVVNRLQSEKIVSGDGNSQTSRDPIVAAARHGHKLLFPTFDGTEDPLSWLNRCEQFFRIKSTEEAGKVFLVAFYMTSDVAQWYALIKRNCGTHTWAEFVKLVNQRFGPSLHGKMLGELIQLKRDTTVADYQSRFLALVNRCTGLNEKQRINIFTAGLRNPLKTDVEIEHQEMLEDAMALARAYEQRLVMTNDAPACTSGHYAPHPMVASKPLALPALPITATPDAPAVVP